MSALEHSEVWRGGSTSPYMALGSKEVHCYSGRPPKGDAISLKLTFGIDSKGGGVTDLRVFIHPDDFGKIVKIMKVVDREKTIEAFANAFSTNQIVGDDYAD